MIGAEIRLKFEVCGNAGCLIWQISRDGYIGIAYFYGVPMYSFLGYIGIWYFGGIPMYLEYMVLCTYIGNARVRAFPMYYYSGFSRRYIGIKNSMSIPMYVGSNLNKIYIGMGQYRPSPMYRQILPKQNTSEFRVFIQSRCISINFPRYYLLSLVVYSRASRPK